MSKKIGDKKISGVKSTTQTTNVEGAEGVSGIGQVKATSGIGGVRGTGGISTRRPTRLMTLAEREELFKIVNEEAESLFGTANKGGILQKHRETIEGAVKMALDGGLIEEEHLVDPEEAKKKKNEGK